jgi:hypothetical protein
MKTGFLIVALTVGLIAGLMTGVSQADGAKSENLAGLYNADPERGIGDSWQGRGPIETGALPGDSSGALPSKGIASDDAADAQVEIGGVKYRVGLDTGP